MLTDAQINGDKPQMLTDSSKLRWLNAETPSAVPGEGPWSWPLPTEVCTACIPNINIFAVIRVKILFGFTKENRISKSRGSFFVVIQSLSRVCLCNPRDYLTDFSEVGLCLYLQTGRKSKSSFQSPADVLWACYNPARPLWSHSPSVSSPFPALGGRGQTDTGCVVYPNYTLQNCRKSSSQSCGCQ